MECCKIVEFGCSNYSPSIVSLTSIKLKSSNNWKKATIYDTFNEEIIFEIINKFDNQIYFIQEKYDNITNTSYISINDVSVNDPSEFYVQRYIIKIQPTK